MSEKPVDKIKVFDALVGPLMDKVYDICEAEGIPVFADFQLTEKTETTDAIFAITAYCGDNMEWINEKKFDQYIALSGMHDSPEYTLKRSGFDS